MEAAAGGGGGGGGGGDWPLEPQLCYKSSKPIRGSSVEIEVRWGRTGCDSVGGVVDKSIFCN